MKQFSDFYQSTKYDRFIDNIQTASMQVDQDNNNQMIKTTE